MQSAALLAVALVLLGPVAATPQEPGVKAKPIAVIEVKLDGKLPAAAYIRDLKDMHKPTRITSAKQLTDAFPNKDLHEGIAKQVNFDKQEILLFAWDDSTREYRFTSRTEDGKDGPVVVFQWSGSMVANDDIRQYAHLFVLPKGTAWRFHGAK